ncbi:MAG: hypothetical protein ACRD2W_18835 [Acidimicrobiales bacterium]
MDDREVIEAFLESATATAFGPSLHIERGTMKVHGWWSVAYRVSDRTVLVRDEEAPDGSTAVADVAAALAAHGLTAVGSDMAGIAMLIYTNLDLGYGPWTAWSNDAATAEMDLNAKATEESFLGGEPSVAAVPTPDPDIAENARGARRLAGAVERVVVAVGVDAERVAALAAALADCWFEPRGFDEIDAAGCGSLLPTLVLVDATGEAGGAFLVALQAEEGVRAPVVAITAGGEMRAGGDASVDAAEPPETWAPLIRDLLR